MVSSFHLVLLLSFYLTSLFTQGQPLRGHDDFPDFLKSARATANEIRNANLRGRAYPMDNVVFVVGNPSGDLDSISSALATSYLLQKKASIGALGLPNRPGGYKFIPVQQITRDQIGLRPENERALRSAGINVNDLIYLDDLPPRNSRILNSAKFFLVDHNSMGSEWWHSPEGNLPRKVIGIIDHHVDTGPSGPYKVINKQAGSTASLVTNVFTEPFSEGKVSQTVSKILGSAIIVDTEGFTHNFQGPDSQAKQTLSVALGYDLGQVATNTFEALNGYKSMGSSLSLEQQTLRDMKIVETQHFLPNGKSALTRIGIPSFDFRSAEEVSAKRAELQQAMRRVALRLNLDAMIPGISFEGGKHMMLVNPKGGSGPNGSRDAYRNLLFNKLKQDLLTRNRIAKQKLQTMLDNSEAALHYSYKGSRGTLMNHATGFLQEYGDELGRALKTSVHP